VIPLKLWYSREQTTGDVVRTHAELDAAIDRIEVLARPGWPALAEATQLDNKLGSLLYLGLHVDRGVLLYAGAGETSRMYTIGEGTEDGAPLLYMQGTSDCEFPPNSEVAVKLIRQAAHEFADTGQRPTCVEWQTWEQRPDTDTESEWPDLP
jgi:immunity protein Imm1 of predicted polymorphic toxin system